MKKKSYATLESRLESDKELFKKTFLNFVKKHREEDNCSIASYKFLSKYEALDRSSFYEVLSEFSKSRTSDERNNACNHLELRYQECVFGCPCCAKMVITYEHRTAYSPAHQYF